MEKFRRQIEELNIPYPQKHDLLQEIEGDLQENDLGDTESFTNEDLARLSDIHRTRAYKLYSDQDPIVRKGLDIAFVYSPLFLMFFLIIKEKSMFAFMLEGGLPGMIVILLLGGILLGHQLFQAFRLGILKDHRPDKRNLDSPSLLIGVGALLSLGLGWSVLGIYVTADSVVKAGLSNQILLEGFKESLTPFLLSIFLSTLILLTHYGSRRLSVLWRIPSAT